MSSQGANHFNYCVPENLFLEELLQKHQRSDWLKPEHLRKLLWFVSFILYSYLTKVTPKNRFVNIPSAVIERHVTTRRAAEAVRLLADLGVIEINERYASGRFSKSYRLTAAYRDQPLQGRSAGKQSARPRLPKDCSVLETDEQKWIYESIKRATIDEEAFESSLERAQMPIEIEIRARETIHHLRANLISLRGGKLQRRVTHVLTRAPGIVRRFVGVDGEQVTEYDIRSCQPALLLTLYPDLLCTEAEEYRAALTEGFYKAVVGKVEKRTKKGSGY